MMAFLIKYVFAYAIDLASGVRKRSIAFLPIKMSTDPLLFVYEVRRTGLYIANEVGDRY